MPLVVRDSWLQHTQECMQSCSWPEVARQRPIAVTSPVTRAASECGTLGSRAAEQHAVAEESHMGGAGQVPLLHNRSTERGCTPVSGGPL